MQADIWRILTGDKVQRDNWEDCSDPALMLKEESRYADLEHSQFREARP